MLGDPPRTYNLPSSYPSPPTLEEREALERRRADFLANPTKAGQRIPFEPKDDPCVYRASDVADPPDPSPNPRRPLDERLLAAVAAGRTRSASKQYVVLKECVSGQQQQVWRCEVERNGKIEGEAVVKLVIESVFPYPDGGSWSVTWATAEKLAAAEARAYAAFQPLQGVDVPYCYGMGRFRLPNGEDVPGFILEDLSPHALRLDDACPWAEDDDNEVEADDIADMAFEIFAGQNRLFACGMAIFEFTFRDIFLLRGQEEPHPVFVDFATCRPLDEYKQSLADTRGSEDKWWERDEAHLRGSMGDLLGWPFMQWAGAQSRQRLRLGVRYEPRPRPAWAAAWNPRPEWANGWES